MERDAKGRLVPYYLITPPPHHCIDCEVTQVSDSDWLILDPLTLLPRALHTT